jgi:hypothetical protein
MPPRTTLDVKEEHKDFYLRPSLAFIACRAGTRFLVGCELGSDVGNNALSVCKYMRINHLHLVDSFERELIYIPHYLPYGECKERLASYRSAITYHIKTTDEAVNDFAENSLDFVYVDADHSYTACLADMKNYWPKVKAGGVLAGHDFNDPRVEKAVADFCAEKTLSYKHEGMDWWIIKEEVNGK